MTPTKIKASLRAQFDNRGNRFRIQPDDGCGMTTVYEIWPDKDETLWARFDSSPDAQAVIDAINGACE